MSWFWSHGKPIPYAEITLVNPARIAINSNWSLCITSRCTGADDWSHTWCSPGMSQFVIKGRIYGTPLRLNCRRKFKICWIFKVTHDEMFQNQQLEPYAE